MVFQASVAFRISTEVRPSTVPGAGEGIFALEPVGRGRFLGMDFPSYRKLCTDRDVPRFAAEKQKYSWRHVEHVCFEAHERRSAADLMNHCFEPNVLWHVGCYFAAEEIAAGDELFVDYRYFFSPSWNESLIDSATGRAVEGMEWRAALLHSSRRLVALLEETAAEAEDDDLDAVSSLCVELRNRK